MTASHTPEHEHASSAPDPHAAAPAPHEDSTSTSNSGRRALLAGLGGLAAGAMFASRAGAGPLNPPAGPITSTGKTLTDIEPRIAVNATNTPGDAGSVFRITQPGSYYLAGNVLGEAGKDGITIAASNVTLDLNGFAVIGVANAGVGIVHDGAPSRIIVRNGSVSDWPDNGVNLAIGGVAGGVLIESIIATENGGVGIAAASDSTLIGCVSRRNGEAGFTGTSCVSMRDCIARDNGALGFQVGNGCALSNCTARDNDASGFSIGTGGTLHNCSAYANGSDGFALFPACVATACIAENNGNRGFSALTRCLLSECAASNNDSHGISVQSNSVVRHCACSFNGLGVGHAGILLSGSDSRLEANLCTRNGVGFEVTSNGNFIARNTCSGNDGFNWAIASGNVCLVVNGSLAGGILGNAGGSAPGSTDPNANFTF